jgi:putative transposase
MKLNKLYFFTATIIHWRELLLNDKFKDIILDSLENLVQRNKIKVYAYVIMPNYTNIIWELLELNGKEYPHASLLKYTSHTIQKDLQTNDPNLLQTYEVINKTRKYQFWQRDSLPIELSNSDNIQKVLNYIHHNPVKGKWALVKSASDYLYSSLHYYEKPAFNPRFLTHINQYKMSK